MPDAGVWFLTATFGIFYLICYAIILYQGNSFPK